MLYEESQRFLKNKLMLVILILSPILKILIGYGLFHQLVLGKTFGNQPVSNIALLLSLIGLIIFFWWITQLKLITKVSEEGITVHFSTLGRFKREIPFSSIKDVEVVTYKGLTDHGGWGWRIGPFGVAYTVYGNQAVKLTEYNQKSKQTKTIYIGSQNSVDLEAIIKNNV